MIFLLFTGHINDCQAILKQKYPHIIYIHCASYSLNLVISDSCEVRLVENASGTIKETVFFFSNCISFVDSTFLQQAFRRWIFVECSFVDIFHRQSF